MFRNSMTSNIWIGTGRDLRYEQHFKKMRYKQTRVVQIKREASILDNVQFTNCYGIFSVYLKRIPLIRKRYRPCFASLWRPLCEQYAGVYCNAIMGVVKNQNRYKKTICSLPSTCKQWICLFQAG